MSASLTTPAWVVASKLPRVPIRITCANWLLGGLLWADCVESCWHSWQFTGGGTGVDGRLVEFEKLTQRFGVAVAAGGAGELLDPHGGRVQQLVHHPTDGAGDLFALGALQAGQPVLQAEQLGFDHIGGPLAQRGHPP